MKRLLSIFLLAVMVTPFSVLAEDSASVTLEYKGELETLLCDAGGDPDALEECKERQGEKADADMQALLDTMEATQTDVNDAYKAVSDRVDSLLNNDGRRQDAEKALDKAKKARNTFIDLGTQNHVELQPSIGGTLPRVIPDTAFELAHEEATAEIGKVNRVLISPARPGAVPEGDVVTDFIPQIIRQLFRFAWLAVLISFTVSGIMLIMAHDNDEKVTKAKQMIWYSLIGFAFIAFAFAIVKGVTDIDFFRII